MKHIQTLFFLLLLTACSQPLTLREMMELEEYEEVPVKNEVLAEHIGIPDEWAKYPGGVDALSDYILNNAVYPEKERREFVTGRVKVSYMVDVDGYAKNLIAYESPSNGFTEMFEELIEGMERWVPAIKDGQPIAQQYVFDMEFDLGK